MKLRKQLAAAFAGALIAAGAAHGAQVVNFANVTKNTIATTTPIFAVAGDVIRFDAQLQQNGPQGITSGLGLCLSYNNTVTGTVGISSLYLSQLVANGGAQAFGTVCDDGGGTPAAGATTMIIKGWADAQGQGGFPVDLTTPGCTDDPPTATCNPVPLPITLYRGTFTVQPGFTGSTQLAFSASSPAQSAGNVTEAFSSPTSPLIVCAAPAVTVGTPVNGSETGPTAASLTVNLSSAIPAECGGGSGLFPVTLTLGGTATVPGQAGADYAVSGTGVSNTGGTVTVNFPANGSTTSAVVTLTPVDDAAVEGTESVSLTVAAGSGNYTGVGNTASANIADNDSGVSVVVTTPGAEGGPNGVFTFTRVGDTTGPLTVNFTLTGTATLGAPPLDYTVSNGAGASAATNGSITFAAGSATAVLNVNVFDDADVEGAETVILTITPDAAYGIGGTNPQTMTISDNDTPPVITVSAFTNGAEPSTNGSFTVTRSGNLSTAPSVNFTVGGSATRGAAGDYTLSTDNCTSPLVGNTLTVPAMATSVTVSICVIDDAATEGTETVSFTVTAGASYTVGAPAAQTANITDDEGPVTVTIVATTPNAAEPSTNGLFTVTRSGGGAAQTANPLTVNIVVTGTASNGTDYQTIANTVIIPAAQTSVTIPVTVIDDALAEGNETVILTVGASANYTVGAPSSGTVTIADDDGPITVSIVATTPNAAEPATNGLFTVTRSNGNAAQNMAAYTVNLSIGGTATNGVDYASIPVTVTIPANQTTVTIPVTVIDDSVLEGNETVVVSLLSGATYVVGAPAAATVTIADDEIGISIARVADAVEGTSAGSFQICRTGSTTGPLVVTFSLSGAAQEGIDFTLSGNAMNTITIPDGQSCATLTVTALDNQTIDPTRDIIVTISPSGQAQVVPGQGSASIAIVDDERPRIIPTMSEWGLLLMGLMLAGIAGFSVRRRRT